MSDRPGLVDALPAMGKSRGIPLWETDTGEPITIYTLRHDLYRQYEESCEELNQRYARIPSQRADCPLGEQYKNTHGKSRHPEADEWDDKVEEVYERLESFTAVHEHFGDQLPCQSDGPCPYVQSREGFHRMLDEIEKGNAEPYDVIIGNYLHSFTPYTETIQKSDGKEITIQKPGRYHKDRYVVFDEFPGEDAVRKIGGETVQESITAYLQTEPDLPFKNYADLNERKDDPEIQSEISKWRSSQGKNRSFWSSRFNGRGNAVAEAPLLTELALSAKPLPVNRYGRAEVGRDTIGVMNGGNGSVWLLTRPPVTNARGVIALDGTPTLELWDLLLPGIEHHPVLPTEEYKNEYIRDQLGLRFIRTSAYVKPYASGEEFDPDKPSNQIHSMNEATVRDVLAFKWMIGSHGSDDPPSLISTKAVNEAYGRAGFLNEVDQYEHYNNLIGTNALGRSRFGIVSGCNYPGDEVVKMWAALCGVGVEAVTNDDGERLSGRNLSFGTAGEPFLHAVRENVVLQAAMRYGRQPDENGNRGATVFVHTSALPEWVEYDDRLISPKLWVNSDGLTDVLRVLREYGDETTEWTAREVQEVLETIHGEEDAICVETARRNLNGLSEDGIVTGEKRTGKGSGRGRPWRYTPENLSELIEFGPGYVVPPRETAM
ncbi:hypothetical protein [Halorubrum salinum]|uniref:hypothetical protein n=1 Tax=Halorubrum salinum TaxID=767517 RepID=UPI002111DFA3|nr:hypothetical protein [Halorubrum salinum]